MCLFCPLVPETDYLFIDYQEKLPGEINQSGPALWWHINIFVGMQDALCLSSDEAIEFSVIHMNTIAYICL